MCEIADILKTVTESKVRYNLDNLVDNELVDDIVDGLLSNGEMRVTEETIGDAVVDEPVCLCVPSIGSLKVIYTESIIQAISMATYIPQETILVYLGQVVNWDIYKKVMAIYSIGESTYKVRLDKRIGSW